MHQFFSFPFAMHCKICKSHNRPHSALPHSLTHKLTLQVRPYRHSCNKGPYCHVLGRVRYLEHTCQIMMMGSLEETIIDTQTKPEDLPEVASNTQAFARRIFYSWLGLIVKGSSPQLANSPRTNLKDTSKQHQHSQILQRCNLGYLLYFPIGYLISIDNVLGAKLPTDILLCLSCIYVCMQGYIFWLLPPSPWGIFSKLKNREEFEGVLEKRKVGGGKRRKKEKSDKTHVKIPL